MVSFSEGKNFLFVKNIFSPSIAVLERVLNKFTSRGSGERLLSYLLLEKPNLQKKSSHTWKLELDHGANLAERYWRDSSDQPHPLVQRQSVVDINKDLLV